MSTELDPNLPHTVTSQWIPALSVTATRCPLGHNVAVFVEGCAVTSYIIQDDSSDIAFVGWQALDYWEQIFNPIYIHGHAAGKAYAEREGKTP